MESYHDPWGLGGPLNRFNILHRNVFKNFFKIFSKTVRIQYICQIDMQASRCNVNPSLFTVTPVILEGPQENFKFYVG